jgi:4-hydroxy-3-methylbut-2-enyl diphosphate reductase IspH
MSMKELEQLILPPFFKYYLQPGLKQGTNTVLLQKHDNTFVSGKESSNGRMLFSVCKSVNPDTHFVSSPEEIDGSWFKGKRSVGICGATSTPKWLIENIRDLISNI